MSSGITGETMIKLASALVLAATLVAPMGAAYAGDTAKDKTSNVDPKATAPGGKKESPGTVGAMNNNAEGGSFTASKADQEKNLTKAK